MSIQKNKAFEFYRILNNHKRAYNKHLNKYCYRLLKELKKQDKITVEQQKQLKDIIKWQKMFIINILSNEQKIYVPFEFENEQTYKIGVEFDRLDDWLDNFNKAYPE